jgi:Tol biopolymer transport system component
MRRASGAALAAVLLSAAGRGAQSTADGAEVKAPRAELVEVWVSPSPSESVVRGAQHFVDFSPDGKRLAVGQDSSVVVFDLKAKKQVRHLKELWGMNQRARFSPDGKKLAGVVNGAAHGYVWDTATWDKPVYLPLAQGRLRLPSLAWLPDNERIVVPAPKGAEIWSVREKKATLLVPFPHPWVVAVNRENVLAVGGKDKVLLWGLGRNVKVAELEHPGWVTTLQFSRDGRTLFTRAIRPGEGRTGHSTRIWQDGRQIKEIDEKAFDGQVEMSLSPDGRRLAVCSGAFRKEGRLTVLDTQTGALVASRSLVPEHSGWVPGWSADGRLLAAVPFGGPFRVWRYSEK